ncbi:kinase-like protein [Gigaspora margarita]|uniref:Kinase-like protein n=1 Tax=Gigaspora margarita TaxID=4874 RepID=A0A8H4EVM2_GIGMA|nr:kinase-like protein [Gigaspora margarita]
MGPKDRTGTVNTMITVLLGTGPDRTDATLDYNIRIAKEIARILFLHENNIIHRDLLRLTGFGLSKQINETSKTSTAFGMPAYVEPQFNQTYKRDKRSDTYNSGVILWEISSGRSPLNKDGKALYSSLLEEPIVDRT